MSEHKKGISKIIWFILTLFLIAGAFIGWIGYQTFIGNNVTEQESHLYIATNDSYENVLQQLDDKKIVKHVKYFDYAAKAMDYNSSVKPGRYKLNPGMSNRELIRNLRTGNQDPIKFRFQNLRLKEHFAALLGANFESDSAAFSIALNNKELAESYGFTHDNFFTMFIPNTYEIYWNTSPDKIIERFNNEYNKFWTSTRKDKAKALNLTPQEVGILASIVKGEALHIDEMPQIAGLYLNRLKKGILLQADPTVIFANNDFTIRRVLNRHLTIDNPYNTYRYRGLPPGPIMLPSIASIDAVLDYAKHDYIYMCAKDDFSGYHNFAKTQAEHIINARKFQRALDERNIKK